MTELLKKWQFIASRLEIIGDAMNDFMPRIFTIRDRFTNAHDEMYKLRTNVQRELGDGHDKSSILQDIEDMESAMCKLADAVTALTKMEFAIRDYSILMCVIRGEIDDLKKEQLDKGDEPTLVSVYTKENAA